MIAGIRLVSGQYFLHAIDHQEVHWRLLRFHGQPELVPHGRDDDGGVQRIRPVLIRRHVQREIEIAFQAGLVHDHAPELAGERFVQLRQREPRRDDMEGNDFLVRTICGSMWIE